MAASDDRFIAKELSRAELQSMESFAPAYFDYMSSAVVAHVGAAYICNVHFDERLPAPYPSGQDLRML